MSYSFTIDGKTYTASSEAGIKQAIADHNFLEGGSAEGTDGEVSYTVEEDGATITVTYGANGVEIKDAEGNDVKADM